MSRCSREQVGEDDVHRYLRRRPSADEDKLALAGSIKELLETGRVEEEKKTLRSDAGTMTVASFQQIINRLRNRQFELLSERDRESYQRAQTTTSSPSRRCKNAPGKAHSPNRPP